MGNREKRRRAAVYLRFLPTVLALEIEAALWVQPPALPPPNRAADHKGAITLLT